MRLGLTLSETYTLIFTSLVLLAIAGTSYGQWALRRATAPEQISRLRVVNSRVKAAWWLILVFAAAFAGGLNTLIVVFALLSFFTLREFLALTPTKQSDHWALICSFYVAIPVQYLAIAFAQEDIFTIFIPVYMFLLLPVLMSITHDSEQFLGRVAKIQWGLMLSIYCISHAPVLLIYEVERYGSSSSLLLLFFLLVIFVADLLVVIASSYLGGKSLPDNPNKTYKGILCGGAIAILVGFSLFWITPFKPWQCLLMSLAIVMAGAMGDIVIAAVKRSLGSRFMDGDKYMTRGTLERLAPFIFAAPVYYHLCMHFFSFMHV